MEYAKNPIKSKQKHIVSIHMKSSRAYHIYNHLVMPLDYKPFVLEHAMEEYIIEHPEILNLSDEYSSPIIDGKEVTRGKSRYDIVAKYKNDAFAIIEVKKGVIDQDALDQLKKYLVSEDNTIEADEVLGVLVGSEIDSSIINTIEQSNNLYAIVLNRYYANDKESVHTVIYSPTNASRNYDKYTLIDLQGKMISNIGKGRLMYHIIRSYIEDAKPTYAKLKAEFPSKLAGRGVRSNMPIVRENTLKPCDKMYIRYYKEELQCIDRYIVVCNQWGIGNIESMIEKAQSMGMKIRKI